MLSLLVSLALSTSSLATVYNLADSVVGTDFLTAFEWQNIPDPTNGRVNYVDQPTALSQNLSFAQGDTFIMRADDTTVLSATGPGRNSIRIQSVNTYTTVSLFARDLR